MTLILVLLTSLAAAGHLRLGVLERLDAWLYDARLLATLPEAADSPVVIVDIDEASLGELGRWPWSRNTLAALVEALFDDYRVQMVGFDVEARNRRRLGRLFGQYVPPQIVDESTSGSA